MNNSFCDTVITIPQTLNTCWFNAMLMMIFYSQYSRKLLLHYNKFDNSKDELFQIFKILLYKSYIKNPKIYEYLINKYTPQKILSLLGFEKKLENGEKIDDYAYAFEDFIYKFLDYLNIEYLILDCFDLKSNKFYVGFYELMLYKYIKINNKLSAFLNISNYFNKAIRDKHLNKINNKIKNEIPKYIIINIIQHTSVFMHYNILYNQSISKPFLFDNSYIKYNNLNKLPNEIIYKDRTYILDSISLSNYNSDKVPGHAIAGITCKNERYVYNGWMKFTNDIAMKNNELLIEHPCELMRFDWNPNESNDFCLDRIKCKLIKAFNPETNLCFSFDKDNRNLIYVLKDENFKSLDYNIKSDKIKNNEIKNCPEDKIYNPITKRCVLKSGKIGKLLVSSSKINISKTKNNEIKKDNVSCPEDKIYNPRTKRCVLKSGKIGKLLLNDNLNQIKKIS